MPAPAQLHFIAWNETYPNYLQPPTFKKREWHWVYEAMGDKRLYSNNCEFHGGFRWKDLSDTIAICNNINT
ncbi:MAG: hypothetical protein QM764_07080 [Chitinophagaceae bacterium]